MLHQIHVRIDKRHFTPTVASALVAAKCQSSDNGDTRSIDDEVQSRSHIFNKNSITEQACIGYIPSRCSGLVQAFGSNCLERINVRSGVIFRDSQKA